MSVQMVLIAAVVSAAGLADSPAVRPPIGIEREQKRERIAQGKRDQTVPGALPGRSEQSEEAGPTNRKGAKKKAKPADPPKDAKKDTPREGGKKEPQ
jgi:hypothetical protein